MTEPSPVPPNVERDADTKARALFLRRDEDGAAREQLIEQNRGLAEHLARRFAGRGEPVEDLVQVATIGLIKAVDRFDVDREVQFSTYASATIVGELKRHFRDKGWAVRVPRRMQEAALLVSKETSELYRELGRSPTVPELAERTGLTDEDVVEATEALHAYSTTSLDAPDDDDVAVVDKLGSTDESLELMDRWADLSPHIKALPDRERQILYMRFFQGRTQAEIAETVGLSQMHVSRLLASTLERLREASAPA
jgi:RNA polymerase sigma-B factor